MSKRSKGWIKLYGSIRESAVWSDPLRLKAWIDILLSANYQDREWFDHGNVHKVKRGQFVTSIRKLAATWNCSKDTVRRILKQFIELHMIATDSATGRYTLVTIVKYEDFQSGNMQVCDTDKDTDKYTDEYTDKYTDKDTDKYTDKTQHKNIKNNIDDKEKKEAIPSPPYGGPDGYGKPPDGWDDEWEADFMREISNNPGATRKEWYEFWKKDD